MARYGEIRPVNFFANVMAGRQAAQDEQTAARQNAFGNLQLDRAQQLNALAQNPNATPEQYVRAGDPQTGAALASTQDATQAKRSQAVSELGALAQKTLALPPEQRKAFTKQAIAAYGDHFKALGVDINQGLAQLDQTPDDQFEANLKQMAQFAAPQKPIEVAAGASLVTPDGKGGFNPAFTAPKADTQPATVQEYEYAKKQGYTGSFQQFVTQMKQAGATTINLGAQGLSAPPTGYARPNPTKPGLVVEPGGPADPKAQQSKPPTEADKKNAVLYSSMTNAEKQIADLEKSGNSTDTSSISNQVLGSNPLTKPLQSEDYRKYEAAALRWSANLLYLKSGATATPEEVLSTRKQFFPQPGDGPEVKAQKAQARQQELSAVQQNMVPGATPQPTSGGWTIKKVK